MTAWNTRKDTLLRIMQNETTLDIQLIKNEMEFGIAAIKCNPKSYGAWYHRKWLISTLASQKLPVDVSYELKLCNKLLDLDARNFHCWNYRWFLTETFKVDVQSEFDFTTLMIYRNFSNYSAWHRRSLLLPKLQSNVDSEAIENIIKSDLKLIRSAYFTEPKDQSCWFYLRWLLSFADKIVPNKLELWNSELENIVELLLIEPDCALPLSTFIFIAKQLGNVGVGEKLVRLQKIDPLRRGMYEEMLQ